MTRFPDAPPGSYVCEEGWLIVGDEAWTEYEWNVYVDARPRSIGRGRPRQYANAEERRRAAYRRKRAKQLGVRPEEVVTRRLPKYETDEQRLEAKRRSNREYMRRKRAVA